MANAAFEIFKMMNVRKEEPKKVIITTYNPYREKEENERLAELVKELERNKTNER